MKKTMMALVMCGFCSLSFGDIAGSYTISGTDPYNNMSYTGDMTIVADNNDVYQAKWTLMEGGKTYTATGTGMMNDAGDEASFVFQENTGEIGLQMYTVTGDNLEGPYVLLGKNKVGNEKLMKKQ